MSACALCPAHSLPTHIHRLILLLWGCISTWHSFPLISLCIYFVFNVCLYLKCESLTVYFKIVCYFKLTCNYTYLCRAHVTFIHMYMMLWDQNRVIGASISWHEYYQRNYDVIYHLFVLGASKLTLYKRFWNLKLAVVDPSYPFMTKDNILAIHLHQVRF